MVPETNRRLGVALLIARFAAGCMACPGSGAETVDQVDFEVRFSTICLDDKECRGDELCNCTTTGCSLCRSTIECFTHIENTCVSRKDRLDVWMPIFVNGGWVLEASDAGAIYDSWESAFSAGFEERKRRAGY